jgi:hypothetical protein
MFSTKTRQTCHNLPRWVPYTNKEQKIRILIPCVESNTNRIGEIRNWTPKMLIRTPLFGKWLNCTNSVYYMRNKTSPALIRSQFSLVTLCYTGRVAIELVVSIHLSLSRSSFTTHHPPERQAFVTWSPETQSEEYLTTITIQINYWRIEKGITRSWYSPQFGNFKKQWAFFTRGYIVSKLKCSKSGIYRMKQSSRKISIIE